MSPSKKTDRRTVRQETGGEERRIGQEKSQRGRESEEDRRKGDKEEVRTLRKQEMKRTREKYIP